MMKNKIFAVLTVVVLCLCFALSVSAADTHIFDHSGYITPDAFNSLEQQAQKIEDTYGCEVIVSVIADSGDKETIEYTKDFYKANVKGENGIALTYNFGAQLYSYHCEGITETLFPLEEQKNIFSNTFGNAETYYDAVYTYLLAVEKVLSEAPDDAIGSEETTVEEIASAESAEKEETTGLVSTDRTLPLVADNADVLTDAEEAELLSRLETLGEANDIEVGVITVDSYDGEDPQAFADDFYEYNGYGYGENDDGFIVVFNTGEGDGNRNIAISTHGKGADLLTDMEIDVIIEMMITPIKNGDFAGAFDTFVEESESAIDESISLLAIPLAIVIGFGIAFLIVKIQASKLKTVVQKADAADYVGNVVLTYQNDQFMYRNVTRSPKVKSDSSSTHTSSSGRTHGGGNKSF